MTAAPGPTAKALCVWETIAQRYDKQMAVGEKVQFGRAGSGSEPVPRAGSWKSQSGPGSTCRNTRPA